MKSVYFFGRQRAEGREDLKNLLGGKGANLAEMTNLGIPVPAGFTITTDVCTYFYENEGTFPADMDSQLKEAMEKTDSAMGKIFGDTDNPLLLSVRSGARMSMPGMMETVLNVGLTSKTYTQIILRVRPCRRPL